MKFVLYSVSVINNGERWGGILMMRMDPAHELGHWSMNHTLKILGVTQVYMLTMFWLFSFFIHNPRLYYDFGFTTKPTLIGFLLFQYIYAPVDSVIGFLMHVYQRKNEYEAGMFFYYRSVSFPLSLTYGSLCFNLDAFALKLGYAETLRTALIKLSVKNLGGFNVDPWYSAWNRSHPSLVERLDALGVKPSSDTPIVDSEEMKKKQ